MQNLENQFHLKKFKIIDIIDILILKKEIQKGENELKHFIDALKLLIEKLF